MTDNGDILNDDDFFGDIVDTPKEGIEQHKNRKCLKSVIDKGKDICKGNGHTKGWTKEAKKLLTKIALNIFSVN